MKILIFAETDENGNFKKDALEIASYASQVSSENGGSLIALSFNASEPERLSNYGVQKIINAKNQELNNFDPEIYSNCTENFEKQRILRLRANSVTAFAPPREFCYVFFFFYIFFARITMKRSPFSRFDEAAEHSLGCDILS